MLRRVLVLAAATCIVVSATTAFAASLGVSSGGLTSFSAATSVPTSTCSLGASADAYVSGALLEADSNFGGSSQLDVRSDTLGNKRTFLRFDLSTCIPASAEIRNATLRLFLASAPSASRTYALYRVSASWGEGSITWNNQPGVGSSSGTVSTGTTSGVTLQWSVTSDVSAFVTGSNDGWRISDTAEDTLGAREGSFNSREGANGPTLEITYYP